ncbi:MAG: FAS1-like dehydratase domain-containing protein, partial [Mycobacteriaceae bacterium]
LVAPLTFISIIGILAQQKMFRDVIPGIDLSQLLQTDQKLVFHRPMVAGDRLVCDVTLESFRETAGVSMLSVKNELVTVEGEVVVTAWTTLAGRSGAQKDEESIERMKGVLAHAATKVF